LDWAGRYACRGTGAGSVNFEPLPNRSITGTEGVSPFPLEGAWLMLSQQT